jgi:hypothetical protein
MVNQKQTIKKMKYIKEIEPFNERRVFVGNRLTLEDFKIATGEE